MFAIKNIIQKSLVVPFYKQHILILGLVYLVMFGAVRGDQLLQYHLKLIEGSLSNYKAMALVFGIWFIYFIRCIYFLLSIVQHQKYLFLQQITLIPKFTFYKILLSIISICLLPISSYSLAIIIVAFIKHLFLKGFVVLGFIVLLHIISAYLLKAQLSKPQTKLLFAITFPTIFNLVKKHSIQIYIKYIFTQQVLQWLLIKLICFIVIKFCFYSSNVFDEIRFNTFIYTMFFLIHTNLIHQFILWENTYLWHTKSLPISIGKRLLNYIILLLIIILPEIILLSFAFPNHLTVYNTIGLVFLSIATILFIFTICIGFQNVKANYSPLLFLYLLLVYGFVLANTIMAFSIIVILCCCISYYFTANKFELFAADELDNFQ